ncbi:MAG: porin family protein [Spirochaetaceae bacterium]|nr:porin family protein [Spirochaetaceae bacterium]
MEASISGSTMSVKTPYFGGGGFAFLDATYAELSVGFFGAAGTFKMEQAGVSQEGDISLTGLDIGLLGKYPFAVNEKLSVFPLLGIGYRIMLAVKDQAGNAIGNSAGDFSALWFRAGGGLDFSFTDHLYVRGGLLYGLRLANKFESDMVDSLSGMMDANTLLGHGLEVRIAEGARSANSGAHAPGLPHAA